MADETKDWKDFPPLMARSVATETALTAGIDRIIRQAIEEYEARRMMDKQPGDALLLTQTGDVTHLDMGKIFPRGIDPVTLRAAGEAGQPWKRHCFRVITESGYECAVCEATWPAGQMPPLCRRSHPE